MLRLFDILIHELRDKLVIFKILSGIFYLNLSVIIFYLFIFFVVWEFTIIKYGWYEGGWGIKLLTIFLLGSQKWPLQIIPSIVILFIYFYHGQ